MTDISNNMALLKCGWFWSIALLIPIGIFIDIVANGHDSGVLPQVTEVAVTDEQVDADGRKTVLYECQDEEHPYLYVCPNNLCPDTLWLNDDDCSDVQQSEPDAALIDFAPYVLAGLAVVWVVAVFYVVTAHIRKAAEEARLRKMQFDPRYPNDKSGAMTGTVNVPFRF